MRTLPFTKNKLYPPSAKPKHCEDCRHLHMVTNNRAHCCKFGQLAAKTVSHCVNVKGKESMSGTP